MLALQISDLHKSYGDKEVLAGLDLQIPAGGFTALLGHNGAGKTTTIGIITGLVRKSGGTVAIFGEDSDAHPLRARRRVALMAQDYNFSQFETVENVVLDQAGFYGIGRKEARQRADRLFRILELDHVRLAQTRNLSGGLKKRMMLARAVISQPGLLVLDEPTAGVDVEARHMIWDFLRQLNREGAAVLLASHYFDEVEELCSRAAVLKDGRICAEGSVAELSSKLVTRTVVFELSGPPPADLDLPLEPCGPNCAEYTYDSASEDISRAVTALASRGCRVLAVRSRGGGLEDYFLSCSGGRSS
ncbi:MAG: ABC transporter ATP-binding protein [Succinivibrionaceae bacterium]|nr:ABC transporter ATP-binding protein [Succinivibrionaceae bacterium]